MSLYLYLSFLCVLNAIILLNILSSPFLLLPSCDLQFSHFALCVLHVFMSLVGLQLDNFFIKTFFQVYLICYLIYPFISVILFKKLSHSKIHSDWGGLQSMEVMWPPPRTPGCSPPAAAAAPCLRSALHHCDVLTYRMSCECKHVLGTLFLWASFTDHVIFEIQVSLRVTWTVARSSLLLLTCIPQYGCTIACSSTHLLKDILVVPSFGNTKAAINICI